MTVVCNHGDGLLVVASQDSKHRSATLGFECHSITDPELQHGSVGVHLVYEPEALHDAVIQIYEFSFGQMIYVDAIHARLLGIIRSEQEPAKPANPRGKASAYSSTFYAVSNRLDRLVFLVFLESLLADRAGVSCWERFASDRWSSN